jgi:uncharacterized protein (TIGR02246 family)
MQSLRNQTKWLSAVLVVAAACAAPAEQAPAVDLAAEAEAVEAVSMQWLEATKARDLKAATSLFADDAVFFDQDEGSIVGLPAIRADIERSWAQNPDFTLSWSTTSVDVALSGDMAWERGSWTYDPDGAGEAGEMTGEYVTVYKKVDGIWKAVSDIGVTHEVEEGGEEDAEM